MNYTLKYSNISQELNIERVVSGDQTEIRRLAVLVSEWIYNVVQSYVHNPEDTEEIVQDTILKVIKNLNNFQKESTLKTWVYRIAINKSKDFLKYKNRKKRFGILFSMDDNTSESGLTLQVSNYDHPGKALESKEQIDILFKGINQLPKNQKLAITLMKLEQMSMKEVAEILDTSPKAVEGLITRARKNLRHYLETEGITAYKKRKHGT